MAADQVIYPLVSIIIPAFNAEKYIDETITSVLKQTYPNIEVIVVNDGSNDKTRQIIETALGHHNVVQLINKANGGAAAARNTGYQSSKGEFIKFLDGDDLINPEMIAQQVKLAMGNSIVSAKWGRFIGNLNTFQLNPEDCWKTLPAEKWLATSWQHGQSMTNPGIFLIPRPLIEKAGLWDESLSLLDDTEYFTRTILAAGKVIFSPESVLYYRSGVSGSLSGQVTGLHAQSAYQSILKSTHYITAIDNGAHIRLLSANFLQTLLYSLYPNFLDLCKKIEADINSLGGSNIGWHASPAAKMLQRFIGWRAAKKLMKAKRNLLNG